MFVSSKMKPQTDDENCFAIVYTVMLQMVPSYNWSPGPSTAIFVLIEGLSDQI